MDETPRPTHTITTPGGTSVELVDELLGADIDAIETAPMRGANVGMDVSGDKPKPDFKMSPADMYTLQQDALIERIVVSIDTTKDDIRGRLGKMKAKDYRFVMAAVKAIADGEDTLPAEKKS